MQETWVQSLSWENPLEEGMATHSSILAWKIPMDRGAWRVIVHGVAKESDTTEATEHEDVHVNILLYICTTSSVSIHLPMDI